jgi:hypothetical protein
MACSKARQRRGNQESPLTDAIFCLLSNHVAGGTAGPSRTKDFEPTNNHNLYLAETVILRI